MSTFELDLTALIIGASLGTASTVLRGRKAVIPPGDGPFTVVIPTGGREADYVHNDGGSKSYANPSAQIVVRAKSFDVAMARAKAIEPVLRVVNTTVSGTVYLFLRPVQEPFDLGPDESGRARVAFNVVAQKRP